MTRRHMALLALVLLSLWLAGSGFLEDSDDLRSDAQRVRPVALTRQKNEPRQPLPPAQILPLRERAAYRVDPSRIEREASIFGAANLAPVAPKPQAAAPAQAPQAPPLPYQYVGKKTEDGQWEVYLTLNDELRIARINTVIDGKYRVDSLSPVAMGLTYLPLNQAQTLSLGASN
jgi:hypothetical protein